MSDKNFGLRELVGALEQSRDYGFISDQQIASHIEHSLEFISLIPDSYYQKGEILDLGAGGGLPSLVWLHSNPELVITTLDAMHKRTRFLEGIRLQHNSLDKRIQIINGRAEILARDPSLRERFTLVVARGFGSPSITAECGSGFLKEGGHLVVSGRPDMEDERWDEKALRSIGLIFSGVSGGRYAHAALLEKVDPIGDRYPRPFNQMKRNPLF